MSAQLVQPYLPGNYHYLPGGFQYSAGVVADPGYALVRVCFDRLVQLAEGFERIEAHIQSQGRPVTALAACELRSPAPMLEADFIRFNRAYVEPLARWGLFKDDVNPVARCNLVPVHDAPAEASFHAFTYTVPLDRAASSPDFATSGAAECPDRPNYREHIARLGETSADALAEKLRFALGDLQSRFAPLGVDWGAVNQFNLYTVHDLHGVLHQELAHRGCAASGVTQHLVRPPVIDLEIEVDARRVSMQRLLSA